YHARAGRPCHKLVCHHPAITPMNHPPLLRPRAVLFDMDGTLTEPLLDFDAIRAELEIAPGAPILEAIAAMPAARRASAMAILHRHEDDAAQRATLNPGCHDLLDWLRRQSIRN